MKRILTIIFAAVIFAAPAQAQLLGELGGTALKAVGALAGKAVINSISSKVEKKIDQMSENTVTKALGGYADSTKTAEGAGGLAGIANAFSGLESLMEKSKTAGLAPLGDFSQQNAARKEHNLTLEYDDWD